MRNYQLAIILSATTFAAFSPGAVLAQITPTSTTAELSEIIVTAQRRSQHLEDVPASVSAIDAATLATEDVVGIQDIGRITPGVNITKEGAFTEPTIRGIGTFSTATGYENNVSVYVDGFYVPATVGNAFDLNNIDHVEVLKGPQGTLFGRNATGGAILVVTKDPAFTPSAEVQVTGASHNDYRVSLYGTTGITDHLAADLAVFERTADGYTKDLRTGDPTAKLKDVNVRSKLLFKPLDELQFTLALQHADTSDPTGLALTALNGNTLAKQFGANPATTATRPHETSLSFPPSVNFVVDSAHLKTEWEAGGLKLTSLTQYDHERDSYATDLDGTYVNFFSVAPWRTTLNTFAQDLNVSQSTNVVDWVAGVFFFDNRGAEPVFYVNGSNTNIYDVRTVSEAAYADGTVKIADGLFLTLGGRYTTEESKLNGQYPPSAPYGYSKRFNDFTPRGALRYEIAPRESVYASVSTGFKSGFYYNGNGNVPVSPEKITAYEVGYKIAGAQLRFDAAAYYYDYKDIQVSVFDLTNGGIERILNAASANIKGVEANLEYVPNDLLNFKVSGGYIHGFYQGFGTAVNNVPNAQNAGNSSVIYDASGQPLLHTPKFSGNSVVEVHPPIGFGKLTLAANYFYSTTSNYILSGRVNQPGYGLLGIRAALATRDDRYSIAVFGDNILGKDYIQGAFVNGLGDFVYWGPPRVFGVTLGAKF